MRIVGFFGEFDAPYVSAVFICDKLEIKRSLQFLIDTGASRTTISDNDAIRLGIDYSNLKEFEAGTVGIGGVVDTYIIEDVELLFKIETGIHTEKFDNIFVLKHKVLDERIKRIPSLIGRDFLNKYVLIMNKKGNKVIIADEVDKTDV